VYWTGCTNKVTKDPKNEDVRPEARADQGCKSQWTGGISWPERCGPKDGVNVGQDHHAIVKTTADAPHTNYGEILGHQHIAPTSEERHAEGGE